MPLHVAPMHSVHLECPRKEAFRAAREALFNACGEHTVQLSASDLQSALAVFSNKNAEPRTPEVQPPADPASLPCVVLNQTQTRILKIGHNTIGRMADNDIVSNDGFMSRRHCAILVHSNLVCELHDLASKNGTFLNGIRIKSPVVLKPGDVIQLGDVRIVFTGTEVVSPLPKAEVKDQTCVLPES